MVYTNRKLFQLKKYIFIFLFLISKNVAAQNNHVYISLDKFQLTNSYDSIIHYGEDILTNFVFDTTHDSKIFYSYFLSKLSLAYNEFNLLEKNNILYSRFLRDSSIIDLSNFNIMAFLSSLVRLEIQYNKFSKADSLFKISNRLIKKYHKENVEARSLYLSDVISYEIAKKNHLRADSNLLDLKGVINSEYSALKFINSSVVLSNYYHHKAQNYKKSESLLNEALKFDSIFNCGASDYIFEHLIDIYSEFNQCEKVLPYAENLILRLKNQIKNGSVDILLLLSASKYLIATSDCKNQNKATLYATNLFSLLKQSDIFIAPEYDGILAQAFQGVGLAFERSDKKFAMDAYILAKKKVENKSYYVQYSEGIYQNISRFYSYLYFDDSSYNKSYLDSIRHYALLSLNISKTYFGDRSFQYYNSLTNLSNYYFWTEDYASFLETSKYLSENACSSNILPPSFCRGFLRDIYYGYLYLKDTANAIKYLHKWNQAIRNYIAENKSYLLPSYETNEELANILEYFNGEVLRNNFTQLFEQVFENLLVYKYYQLVSKIELKKYGQDNFESISIFDINTVSKVNKNRIELEKILNDKIENSSRSSILNMLNSDEVSIEIFKCKFFSKNEFRTRTDQYYAILALGSTKKLVGVYLGDEDEIKRKFDIIYSSDIHGEDYTTLYGTGSGGLSDFILSPLMPYISNFKTLYISTYGFFSNINFNILPISDSTILEDKFVIHNLFSSSDIANFKNNKFIISQEYQLNLFGGIFYDSLSKIKSDLEISATHNYKIRSGKNIWEYLPQTKIEINEIGKIFENYGVRVKYFSGRDASENKFYSSISNSSPTIYHFATHGFSIDNKNKTTFKSDFELQSTNQLDLSGIILAGANAFWGAKRIGISNASDGILTSSEFAALDLSNCKLIVLSACETGLGAQLSNDGIFGLQRGLKLSGINNIITSLWSVPDKSTSELFQIFYSKLSAGYTLQNSLRLARLEMRKKYKSPYYWGAFTLVE